MGFFGGQCNFTYSNITLLLQENNKNVQMFWKSKDPK